MSPDHTAPAGSLPVLDLDGACEFLELSRAEIMVLVPQAMIEIREKLDLALQAIASGEFPDACRYAHTIKSVSASIGAEAVRQSAETLELHTKSSTPTDASQLAETMATEITRLTEAINALPE